MYTQHPSCWRLFLTAGKHGETSDSAQEAPSVEKKNTTTTTKAHIHGRGEATPTDKCQGAHGIADYVRGKGRLTQGKNKEKNKTKTRYILQIMDKICSAGWPVL